MRQRQQEAADDAARAALRGLMHDARSGRLFWDGGPEWEQVRLQAWRRLVLAPALRWTGRLILGVPGLVFRRLSGRRWVRSSSG